ncbi:MAG: VWA domain-containing protein [Chitinivibrionales bacterium]|nr:VWA domain-containing protein [Chitinivibrionales bacterium]
MPANARGWNNFSAQPIPSNSLNTYPTCRHCRILPARFAAFSTRRVPHLTEMRAQPRRQLNRNQPNQHREKHHAMRLKNPEALFLLLIWIPMLWAYLYREFKSRPAVRFSDLSIIRKLPSSPFVKLRHSLIVLRLLGVGLLIVALARPQKGQTEEEVSTEGVDIMIVLDVSFSMKALDFKPNRLNVAKETAKEFIIKRKHDRIGFVVFGSRSYTKCPLTLDYNILSQFVDDVDFEDFGNGTAIGTAIATASNRIKESQARSKVLVLLTDGANNTGEIDPVTAAQAAAELGIKIYTIGVGKTGIVPMPMQVQNPFTGQVFEQIRKVESDLDEQALVNIADVANGQFFRATSEEELKEIYAQIDKLEKTEIKTMSYTTYSEQFFPWLLAGTMVLLLELLLAHTRFRRIP